MKIKGWSLHKEGHTYIQWTTDTRRYVTYFFGERMPNNQKFFMLVTTKQHTGHWAFAIGEWDGKDAMRSLFFPRGEQRFDIEGKYARNKEQARRMAVAFMKTHRV